MEIFIPICAILIIILLILSIIDKQQKELKKLKKEIEERKIQNRKILKELESQLKSRITKT